MALPLSKFARKQVLEAIRGLTTVRNPLASEGARESARFLIGMKNSLRKLPMNPNEKAKLPAIQNLLRTIIRNKLSRQSLNILKRTDDVSYPLFKSLVEEARKPGARKSVLKEAIASTEFRKGKMQEALYHELRSVNAAEAGTSALDDVGQTASSTLNNLAYRAISGGLGGDEYQLLTRQHEVLKGILAELKANLGK